MQSAWMAAGSGVTTVSNVARTVEIATIRRHAAGPTLARQGVLQRKCACGNQGRGGECAECAQKKGLLQRKASDNFVATEFLPIVHDVLRSPGQPLDSATLAWMEPRSGHDFSQVRVHTDSGAGDSARAVNALAYTVGRDIVFDSGQYVPKTGARKQLLAHELTHVVQQREAPNQNLLQRLPREPGDPNTLPYKEAMEETERGLYNEFIRDCSGVRVLHRLEREAPISPLEKVRRLEDRLTFIRHYFLRVKPALSNPAERAVFRCVVDCIFGKDYALTSEERELANVRCEISETRWQSLALARQGQIPRRARSMHPDKVPWIPDPRVCSNAAKMEELRKGILAGRGCEGETGKGEINPLVL